MFLQQARKQKVKIRIAKQQKHCILRCFWPVGCQNSRSEKCLKHRCLQCFVLPPKTTQCFFSISLFSKVCFEFDVELELCWQTFVKLRSRSAVQISCLALQSLGSKGWHLETPKVSILGRKRAALGVRLSMTTWYQEKKREFILANWRFFLQNSLSWRWSFLTWQRLAS